ncbi:FAD-dependent oxidoreductase [Candidatus Micrarchaeota archaeon]|nr:FAD-dependent oxidoreductase [Candidatus Micrarchaeota archaeon]
MEPRKYKITKISVNARGIKLFELEPNDGVTLEFKPGQFVKIFNKQKTVFRPYSIASTQKNKNLEFCIKVGHDGVFTKYLNKLKEGDELWVEGPTGHFVYDGQSNCVFIAGGAGIAPIIAMIRCIVSNKIKGNFVLVYSNKRIEDIAYFDELNLIIEKNKNIKVVYTLTQEAGTWTGEKGRINSEMIRRYVKEPAKNNWFICGPVQMIITLKDDIVRLGVKSELIKVEGWGK